MNRVPLFALVAGSLLGSGCGPESQPPPVSTDSVYVDPVPSVSTLAGYAWDPEAFFINVQNCGGRDCPIPTMLSEAIPLFSGAAVNGASVMVVDPLAGAPVGAPQLSGPDGTWRIEGIPGRKDVPYFIVTTGTGTLGEFPPGFPLPPAAPANYVPTLTARPIFATSAGCYFQEAAQASDNGVLEAVARYRTAKGQATTVANLLDPKKFAAVSVFWLYEPALLPSLMVPAGGTTLEVSEGISYHLDWAQPGSLSGVQQSTRGFYVKDGAGSSPIGVTAVLVPAGPAAPAEVTYTPVDTVVDAARGRPYQFFPVPLPAVGGQVSVASLQLLSGFPPPEDVSGSPPAFFCLF